MAYMGDKKGIVFYGKIDFSLTQVETKKVIKKYQNFFEEIGVI